MSRFCPVESNATVRINSTASWMARGQIIYRFVGRGRSDRVPAAGVPSDAFAPE